MQVTRLWNLLRQLSIGFFRAKAIGRFMKAGVPTNLRSRLKRQWNSMRVWVQRVRLVLQVLLGRQGLLDLLDQRAAPGQQDLQGQLARLDQRVQQDLQAQQEQLDSLAKTARRERWDRQESLALLEQQAQQAQLDLQDLQDQLDQLVLMVRWEPLDQQARRAELAQRVALARQAQ